MRGLKKLFYGVAACLALLSGLSSCKTPSTAVGSVYIQYDTVYVQGRFAVDTVVVRDTVAVALKRNQVKPGIEVLREIGRASCRERV